MKSKFKKIVGVTGSTGFLGSALCKDIKKQNKFELVKFRGNILNKNHLKKWFRENNIEYLIHLAAVVPTYKFVNNKDYAKKVNFVGTKNIVYELNKSKYIRWFFYSSTSHIYKFNNFKLKESSLKRPFSAYGKTKLKAEYYLKEKVNKNIRLCCGRIFSLEGKKKTESYFLPGLKSKIRKNKKIKLNMNDFRDFIHIDDVVGAIIELMKKKVMGDFNIATGKKTSFLKIINIVKKIYKKKIFIEKLNDKDVKGSYADIRKIQKTIKWSPRRNINYILKDYFNK